jgi:surface antigen
MLKKMYIALALSGAVAVTGCASNQYQGQNEQAGMVIGGVLGGLLGNQVKGHGAGRTAAVITGTLAGAYIGGSIGRSMDAVDRMRTGATLEGVRTGVPSSWRNPDTGNVYTVTPTKTYETQGGPCREYSIDAMIGGRKEQVYGTACRQADGSWQIQG